MNQMRLQEASKNLQEALQWLGQARDDIALMKDRIAAPETYLDEAIASAMMALKISDKMRRYLA